MLRAFFLKNGTNCAIIVLRMENNFKRTKILATIGPRTNNEESIQTLIKEGANGFRLNFSHGEYSERDQQIAWIREKSEKMGRHVAILQDLQGPKIRLGKLQAPIEATAGDEFILDYATEGQSDNVLPVQYNLAQKVKVSEPVYIFDGKIKTIVTDIVSETAIKVRVENSGTLMSNKGINLPNTDFAGDIITEKDMRDIQYGLNKDIDFVALSFIQSPDDVRQLRKILKDGGSHARIISKIETKAAIEPEVMEEIVKESDGVMVARGDLAIEAGDFVVPVVQRKLIELCRRHCKLVIVATQMLSSMTDNPSPTRAEVSDVANAVIQGADVVMLSDETANGDYPIETVQEMRRIIMYTQTNISVENPIEKIAKPNHENRHAISRAAVNIAKQLNASAIIAETKNGSTARSIAGFRPDVKLISVTSQKHVAQQLSLRYDNRSFVRPDSDDAGYKIAEELKDDGYFGTPPATVVIVSGSQPGVAGMTNRITIRTIQ